VKVSGLDEIRLRYTEEFAVETAVELADGKPMAYKLRPLKPMALFAMGFTWPVAGEGKQRDDEDTRASVAGIVKIVARSIVSARELYEREDGAWEERWTPIEVVCDRPVNPDAKVREIRVEEIDYLDTITRCWNEMLQRFQLQRGNGGPAGRGVRSKGTRKPRNGRKDVREVATRAGVREERPTDLYGEATPGQH